MENKSILENLLTKKEYQIEKLKHEIREIQNDIIAIGNYIHGKDEDKDVKIYNILQQLVDNCHIKQKDIDPLLFEFTQKEKPSKEKIALVSPTEFTNIMSTFVGKENLDNLLTMLLKVKEVQITTQNTITFKLVEPIE